MDEYKIIITPDAEADLNELDDYMSYHLMDPDTAINCIRYIRSKKNGDGSFVSVHLLIRETGGRKQKDRPPLLFLHSV